MRVNCTSKLKKSGKVSRIAFLDIFMLPDHDSDVHLLYVDWHCSTRIPSNSVRYIRDRCLSPQYAVRVLIGCPVHTKESSNALTQISSSGPVHLLPKPCDLIVSLRVRASNLEKVRRPFALDVPPAVVNRLT